MILKILACLKDIWVAGQGGIPTNVITANGGIHRTLGSAWLWEWCGLAQWKAAAACGRCWPRGSAWGSCDHCQGLVRNKTIQDLPDVSQLVTSFIKLLGKLFDVASVCSPLFTLLAKPGGQDCQGTFHQYPCSDGSCSGHWWCCCYWHC